MAWSKDEVERAEALWNDGLSGTQVARAIGNGKTRNAVIGLARRRGWVSRGPRTITPARPRAPRLPSSAPVVSVRREVEPPSPPLTLENGDRVTILTINARMCAFPIGDPSDADFHFCGTPPRVGSIYCAPHHVLTHQPLTEKQQREPRPW